MNSVITPVKNEERTRLGIQSGDTVRVHQKVIERGKTRIQVFEGLVITVKHGAEAGGTFTVRAVLSGIGVEKTFPLYTPLIDKIEIVKRSKVRRAKLYFIREKAAKAVRRQLRNARMMNLSTTDLAAEEGATPAGEDTENMPLEATVEEETSPVEGMQESEEKKEEVAA
ncbi:MAG: 50S ribosomal protein L19 [Parcubacteria group bacterium 21-54-25]|nr:MAG: 50S ribosomal protein L19 [Parcubacteria group bacterium 21-54-25]